MPTITRVPSGLGTVSGSWGGSGGSPLYTWDNVDEGSSSPSDADYITASSDSAILFYSFPAMPSDFGTATGLTGRFRCINASKGTPRKFLNIQLFQSNESTAISSTMDTTGSTTSWATLSSSISITGATSKTVWDAMRLRIITNTGGAGTPFCSMIELEITYSTDTPTDPNVIGLVVGNDTPSPPASGNIWLLRPPNAYRRYSPGFGQPLLPLQAAARCRRRLHGGSRTTPRQAGVDFRGREIFVPSMVYPNGHGAGRCRDGRSGVRRGY